MLFASGQSRLLPAELRDLLKLICSADALHQDNLSDWLASEDATQLIWELLKQGSLEFAHE
jgi:50S ribosomal protein L16 3-hydroxylase